MERLQKFLSEAGVTSRRKAEMLILQGRVMVNGKAVTELGAKVNPDKDKVIYDGIEIKKPQKFVYYMVNKPQGYISAVSDDRGRKSVVSLLPGDDRIYPAGRLDYDTTGLIILTNDGGLAFRITHPGSKVDKEYIAVIDRPLGAEDIEALKCGVDIGGFVTSRAKVSVIGTVEDKMTLKITIHEGKNRQIRRMVKAVGARVVSLKREAIGKLRIGNLPIGGHRALTDEEISYLKGSYSHHT